MERVFVDHSQAPVERTRWRTLAVFAHTFSCSARVVGRAAVNRLDAEAVDAVVERWCGHVFGLSKATLTAEGLDRFDPSRPYLLLSNHRSLLDIPAICSTFPGRVRFVAKAELRRVPMFGRAMGQAGILFVDRHDRAKAIASLEGAKALARDGTSVWIAAEGGRSRDGSLGPFKKGPFHVALQAGLPLLPTWIEGADSVIPAGSLVSVTGQRVHVRYGAPIETEGLGAADIPALMERSRAALLALA
ncbi:MAG: 1-acyl-sn-glycerol-3-phosphate acyltransferase [Alphaproteobacteria bacterium]|nr:1-acyl-sn-glycerol-3-phosphate acyltransferase [Alphaproteobacteria bacterium]